MRRAGSSAERGCVQPERQTVWSEVWHRVPRREEWVWGVGWRPFYCFSNTPRACAWAVPSAWDISPLHFHSYGSLLTQLSGGWSKGRTLGLMGGVRRGH